MNFVILGVLVEMKSPLMEQYINDSSWFSFGGLFLMVGYLYDRYKSRNIFYYRFSLYYALYTIVFFIFVLANIGFPPTQFCFRTSYFMRLFETNIFVAFFSGFAISLFAGISGFWIYTRCFLGILLLPKAIYLFNIIMI